MDLGIVDKPVVWFSEDADRALWAVIISIVWKVVGFGMLLFVAAIQAIPQDIDEAAMADGAGYWQRVRWIVLPLLRGCCSSRSSASSGRCSHSTSSS